MHPALEISDHDVADVDPIELVDRMDAAGGEDVEPEDLVADDVDADEVHAVGEQLGAQDVADAGVDGGELARAARGAVFGGGPPFLPTSGRRR